MTEAAAPSLEAEGGSPLGRLRWVLLAVGSVTAVVAAVLAPGATGAAAAQVWPPFVLVSGLLLLGLVADRQGLFAAVGTVLARLTSRRTALFVGSAAVVAVVTALLNLDTAVVFLTPILIYTARRHGTDEAPFLYLAVMMANGASLLLAGSNLTNLIVIDHLHQSGGAFAARMLPAWGAAVVVVTVVVAVAFRRHLGRRGAPGAPPSAPTGRASGGIVAFLLVALIVVLLLPPAWAALATAATAIACFVTYHLRGDAAVPGRPTVAWSDVRHTIDLPVLVGLFGLAVASGCLGRSLATVTSHLQQLSSWETAGVGAGLSVLVNNLPAASFLAARSPSHPYALLVGLDLGPNLAVTGALSAFLWLQVGRRTGARPSVVTYSLLGLVVAPISIAAALAALDATH